ncbi:MAG: UbiA family prenyltransferase [Verrucomicrobia bacterium]|nr:UbiA family prenyltransferase [Verrucomicrobiota bacterium]
MNSTGPGRAEQRWRAWWDLARAGNLPSVASNVTAALVLAGAGREAAVSPGLLALAVVAGGLTYAGGATLNDVADAAFDARHRPERAIPRGVISRGAAAAVGAGEMIVGLGLLVAAGAGVGWVLALAATILAYDWLHKRWSGSILLMAGCRVLLGLSVASLGGKIAGWPLLIWRAVLFSYIAGLSWLARREYRPGAPAAAIGRQVGRLLAFIPLVDAVALAVCGAWGWAIACALAVPAGRLAQRLAAST